MDLSIITVTWNAEKEIGRQIQSVFSGCKNIDCEIIISDNGSSDSTVELIRKQFLEVVVIENKENIGFGAANNRCVQIAKGEFILFLNPDMKVEEGSLDTIIDWMRIHSSIGIASPKLIDENGNFNWDASPRRFPKVWEQVALILKLPHLFPKILDSYYMRDLDPDKEQEVDSVRAAFIIVRRELIERLGWAFDPRYFIWFEDVDICRECKKNGFKLVYTPVISCIDYVGQSFKKRKTLWKQKQFTKSMLQYFQKWEPWYKWIWIALVRPVGILLAWVHDFFVKK
ncbi:MAG: glycosyltransferase family 2 protein [Candidatus Magasanikbacteria bacterium]